MIVRISQEKDYSHVYTAETAAAQVAAYPPYSDVVSKMQVVPCKYERCGLVVLCPQVPTMLHWHASHREVTYVEDDISTRGACHSAGAVAMCWCVGEEEIFIWLPD